MENKVSISSCNKIINEAESKRKELLLEIAILVYEKIRKGEIVDLELCEACKPITGLDYTIYSNKKKIQEMTSPITGCTCKCGAKLSVDDKFCNGCGKKIEVEIEEIECMNCYNCKMEIPNDSRFCPACGYKLKENIE